MDEKYLKKISVILWILAVAACILYFLPVRDSIIHVAEWYKGKYLSYEVWRHKLIILNTIFIFLSVIIGLMLYFIRLPFFKKSKEVLFDLSPSLTLLQSKKFFLCLSGYM